MSLPTISPQEAKRLHEKGAALVDIREAAEHARENIPDAHLLPLSRLDSTELDVAAGQPVVFHCKSGMRTMTNAARIAAKVGRTRDVYLMEGGLAAWKRAGLPVTNGGTHASHRQWPVGIGTVGLAVAGAVLGLLVSPRFFIVPALVGAALALRA